MLTDHTRTQQQTLASFCRKGEGPAAEGMYTDREQHYRKLVYNVVKDSLDGAYPIARTALSEEEWDTLCHQFFAEHACQSAQIWEMPRELMDFMLSVEHPLLEKYAFLRDLLLFEWMEIEVYMMEDVEVPEKASVDVLQLNPEFRLLQMRFPVHKKRPQELSTANEGNHFVLLYRHPETCKVQFISLSPFLALGIQKIAEESPTVDLFIETMQTLVPDTDVKNDLIAWLESLREKSVLL